MRPSGACSRTSLLDVVCRVISYDTVGIVSRSGLMGGCQTKRALGITHEIVVGVGGEVLTVLRVGAWVVR
jgi:hypothetical protein